MPKKSAGLLLHRTAQDGPEVFLVHPGGPFWARKDLGAWSIPKGEFTDDEDPLTAAKREFSEETGLPPPPGPAVALRPVGLPGRKVIYAWAVAGDADPAALESNTFALEWPPKSGRIQRFPEVDRAGWFTLAAASEKLHKGQVGLIDQLRELLGVPADS